MKPTGWVCVDGVELVNHYRTLTYLRRGLGGSEWDIKTRRDPYGLGATYVDVFGDPHVVDAFSPMNLLDWCEQGGDPNGYVSPAADPAPWYVAARPESGEFLGVLLDDIDDRAPTRRTVTARAAGGASVGRLAPSARTAGGIARLVATTEGGMEYGRRWVRDLLLGGLCGCELSEVVILPACPDDPEVDNGYRRYARAGTIDGPDFAPVGDIGECKLMEMRWQWAAEVPWLLSQPDPVAEAVTLAVGETVSLGVTSEEWVGDTGVAIRLTVPDGTDAATNLRIRAYPVPEGGDCPTPGSPSPCTAFDIPTLAANAVLEVDASSEQAVHHNPTSKRVERAWGKLDFDGPWTWLIVPPCSTVCVQVTNAGPGADVTVEVERIAREA